MAEGAPVPEAKKEEPADAPTVSEPGAAAPVELAQEASTAQAAAASTPTGPTETGEPGSESAQEAQLERSPQAEQ